MNTIPINSDQELILRIRNGDQVAFELVFYRYKGKLYDFIRHSLPAEEDPESMVQEVFTKLWINRKQLDPSRSLNPFLYTIARNEVFGQLRKMLVRRKYLEELNYSVNGLVDSTEQQFEYEELKKIVAQLIQSMPGKRREIFEMSRNEGLNYREIATALGISENTVDTQIRKALAFLRENLRKRMSLFLFFVPLRKKVLS
ncbi:MAG: hypothetical protein A2W90_14725 [Bacteroidetes bacterium GWF2_42_66]|nr:MAG: hypothetical protein A2W89_04590 [Bacteroidetes bacterium GWE2_42_39]OFY46777.1 MAG: hypothetical protein A2W90_14725 [Bacteroidetes bacterium GWF2_42_66]HAZ04553.1 hypothetical protein [Marinilabiliales bacterium]HBL73814.1 hypothetical protein [Prolixibacteraceae bacterium]HCU63253.1 hypothetical protein [Prolixibacteraceae bacterium]